MKTHVFLTISFHFYKIIYLIFLVFFFINPYWVQHLCCRFLHHTSFHNSTIYDKTYDFIQSDLPVRGRFIWLVNVSFSSTYCARIRLGILHLHTASYISTVHAPDMPLSTSLYNGIKQYSEIINSTFFNLLLYKRFSFDDFYLHATYFCTLHNNDIFSQFLSVFPNQLSTSSLRFHLSTL
jgi:hypothetical protein